MELMDIRQQLKKLVQDGCETADYIMRVSKTPKDGIYAYEELQELVRCRDCKRYRPKEGQMFSCRFEYKDFTQWRSAEPDGFCAWGERR